jgi:hypothetical protein
MFLRLTHMDKQALRQHITEKTRRVQELSREVMKDRTPTERNRLEAELRVAQQALAHYQQEYQQAIKGSTVGQKTVIESTELRRLAQEIKENARRIVSKCWEWREGYKRQPR